MFVYSGAILLNEKPNANDPWVSGEDKNSSKVEGIRCDIVTMNKISAWVLEEVYTNRKVPMDKNVNILSYTEMKIVPKDKNATNSDTDVVSVDAGTHELTVHTGVISVGFIEYLLSFPGERVRIENISSDQGDMVPSIVFVLDDGYYIMYTNGENNPKVVKRNSMTDYTTLLTTTNLNWNHSKKTKRDTTSSTSPEYRIECGLQALLEIHKLGANQVTFVGARAPRAKVRKLYGTIKRINVE